MQLHDTFVAGLDARNTDNISLVLMPADLAVELPWPHIMRRWKKERSFRSFWSNYLELCEMQSNNVVVIVQSGTPSDLVDWITQQGSEVLWLSERSAQTFLTESADLEIGRPYQRAHALALSGAYRLRAQNIVHETFVQVQQFRHQLEALAGRLDKIAAALPLF